MRSLFLFLFLFLSFSAYSGWIGSDKVGKSSWVNYLKKDSCLKFHNNCRPVPIDYNPSCYKERNGIIEKDQEACDLFIQSEKDKTNTALLKIEEAKDRIDLLGDCESFSTDETKKICQILKRLK